MNAYKFLTFLGAVKRLQFRGTLTRASQQAGGLGCTNTATRGTWNAQRRWPIFPIFACLVLIVHPLEVRKLGEGFLALGTLRDSLSYLYHRQGHETQIRSMVRTHPCREEPATHFQTFPRAFGVRVVELVCTETHVGPEGVGASFDNMRCRTPTPIGCCELEQAFDRGVFPFGPARRGHPE